MSRELLEVGGQHIDGVAFESLWSIPNGDNSYVIPLPTLRSTNIVFKGDNPFSFGHFGAHLGQEDRLVFLGPKRHKVRAFFLDCRVDSATFRQRLTLEFEPSSSRLLVIPPGVAHAFDTTAATTLNLYRMFLPPPDEWLSGQTSWTVAGDIVNVPYDVLDSDVPQLRANTHPASEMFYQLMAGQQREDLRELKHEYPMTQAFDFQDGGSAELKLWKRLGERYVPPEWDAIPEIVGAGWSGNLTVWTGEQSGYVPLLDARPRHLIDHGEDRDYSHDAYGIHLGGVDHLTFVGPSYLKARVELVDCREGSPSLHKVVAVEFSPNPLRTLVIPCGVAHRFEHMEGIFTINQPLTFLPSDSSDYQPGNDVRDWPIEKRPFPTFRPNTIPADLDYYRAVVAAQATMTATPPTHATPSILQCKDAEGNDVALAMRKRLT